MAKRKRGRPRKKGNRTATGQLSRAKRPEVVYDKGSSHSQASVALYGQDGCDAIGRAFRCGFLGQGSEAKALLDRARRICKGYWAAYEVGRVGCTLGDRGGGNVVMIDSERAKLAEDRLKADLDVVKAFPAPYRRSFEQLVIDPFPDHGPDWLDTLCAIVMANRERRPDEQHAIPLELQKRLDQALKPLRELTN